MAKEKKGKKVKKTTFRQRTEVCRSVEDLYDPPEVPEIRLTGKWIAQCGFEAGQEVSIKPKQGKIIITS